MLMRTKQTLLPLLCGLLSSPLLAADTEVLHFWTSGGEARALDALKQQVEADGYQWKDFSVNGGGGENANAALERRAMAGNPPTAALMMAPEIQHWGEMGFTGNISAVATAGNWSQALPPAIDQAMQYDGQYVAAPINVHRINWLWANPSVLAKVDAKVPTTWDEFFITADKLKAAGIIPLAHGRQAWQDATLFEAVTLGIGGAEFYHQAFVELKPAALGSQTMLNALETFKRLGDYFDPAAANRDWDQATALVINGDAAMQIMGDWAKGEFSAAGLIPGEDILCAAAPGSGDAYSYLVNSFVMFDVTDSQQQAAQRSLADNIMSPAVQAAFNQHKGSIPVRTDVPMDSFDSCAQRSMTQFKAAADNGTLMPSWVYRMTGNSLVTDGFYNTLTRYLSGELATAEDAAKQLVRRAQVAR